MKRHEELMMKWFDDKPLELKMIYRGTEHQFSIEKYDDLCLNKGPTLTVIQTTKD